MTRHGAVTTLGVLGIVFGAIGTFFNGLMFATLVALKFAPPAAADPSVARVAAQITTPVLLSAGVNVLTAVMILIAGIGLLRLQGWARVWYLASAGLTIINRLATFPLHFQPMQAAAGEQAIARIASILGDAGTIVFCLAALWVLTRPAIADSFRRGGSPPAP